ncbi:MAG TPA: hypothetical protein VF948_00780 [Methylomirabilota bacterium]
MDALRTLEILITSRTPIIAIETLEEDRVEQALERIPLFVWTMTRGLRRGGALEPLYDTKEPLKALRNLSELPRAEEIDALREWATGRAVPAS